MSTMKAVRIHEFGDVGVLTMVHPSGEQMAELAKLANAGQLKTHLDAVFPLKM